VHEIVKHPKYNFTELLLHNGKGNWRIVITTHKHSYKTTTPLFCRHLWSWVQKQAKLFLVYKTLWVLQLAIAISCIRDTLGAPTSKAISCIRDTLGTPTSKAISCILGAPINKAISWIWETPGSPLWYTMQVVTPQKCMIIANYYHPLPRRFGNNFPWNETRIWWSSLHVVGGWMGVLGTGGGGCGDGEGKVKGNQPNDRNLGTELT
jgi:hypothetical protein